MRPPRGYVEPDPNTFQAYCVLIDEMARQVQRLANLKGALPDDDNANSEPLRNGIIDRLKASAEKSRLFAAIAEKELRNQELSDSDYEEILYVGAAVEHDELSVRRVLPTNDLALSNPDPNDEDLRCCGRQPSFQDFHILKQPSAVRWSGTRQFPYFGRREIVKGSVYSYYEFTSPIPLNDVEWAGERDSEWKVGGGNVDLRQRPAWVEPFISKERLSSKAPF